MITEATGITLTKDETRTPAMRKNDREEIKGHIDEFIAGGGEIEILPPGLSSGNAFKPKKGFNNNATS